MGPNKEEIITSMNGRKCKLTFILRPRPLENTVHMKHVVAFSPSCSLFSTNITHPAIFFTFLYKLSQINKIIICGDYD